MATWRARGIALAASVLALAATTGCGSVHHNGPDAAVSKNGDGGGGGGADGGGGGGIDASGQVTLTVTLSGPGTLSDDQGKLTCGANSCTGSYAPGTQVVLTGTPGTNAEFKGWGGDCASSGTETCTLTLSADASATVAFALMPAVTLTIGYSPCTSDGSDTMTDTAGHTCTIPSGGHTQTCTYYYPTGTRVTYTAAYVVGWTGACSGSSSQTQCTVTVNANTTAGANFICITAR